MKKNFLTFILCLLTTVTASAVNGLDAVTFCGTYRYLFNETNWTWDLSTLDVDDDWEKTSGTATWNGSTRTLTLNNVYISRYQSPFSHAKKDGIFIECYTSGEVNVVVKGNCTVFPCSGSALYAAGNVTFTGNGTLYLGGSEADIRMGWSNTTLTVDGPAITLAGISQNAQMLGTNDKTCSFRMESGSVKFEKAASGTPDAANAYAISRFKSVSMSTNIGIKTPHGAYFNSTGYLYDVDGNIIKGQEVLITKVQDYGIKIMGIAVTEANYDVLTKRLYNHFWDTAKDGKINYNPSSNTLTLEKVCIRNNTDLPTIDNISANGLKIILKGQNYFDFLHEDSKDNLMLRARVNTTIATTSGKSGSMANYNRYGGIYVSGGATLTLDGTNYVMYVHPSHIHGGNGTIDYRGLVDLRCNGHEDGTIRSVRFKKKMPLWSDMDAPRFIWNRTDGTPGVYESRTSLTKGEVRFVQEDENFIQRYKYIYVGDEYIHEYNKSCFMSGCIKEGYLTYSPYTKELTLHKATIETDADVAIELGEEATINLIGQNTIKCNSQNNPLAIFVSNSKPLTIQEDATSSGGSLTITSNAAGGSILVNNTLTVNSKLTVPELYADLLELNNCEVKVTRLMHSNASSNLYDIPVRLNGVAVASSEASPAYYNPTTGKVVMKNGTVKFVKKTSDTTVRGLTFCGIPIDDNNKDFIWTEQLQSGTVKYDKANKQIKLIGAVINNKTENHAFEFNGFTGSIYTQGSNTIHCTNANSRSLYLDNASTIDLRCPTDGSTGHMLYATGTDGSTTSAGSFFVGESCKLSKNDNSSHLYVNVPHIHGMNTSSAPSTLYVGSAYLTVTGNTKKGTVRNIKCQVGPNAELYSVASNPLVIDNEVGICAEGGGLYTGEVKFVKKGESYIPVEKITLNKQTLALTKKRETAQLTATVLPADATNRNVRWESWDESVATVDANGKVTAVGNGETQIYAFPAESDKPILYYEEPSSVPLNRCNVTVNIPEPTSIALDRTEYMFQSESVSAIFVRATLTPDNADYDEIEWESSDESIAYVVGSGKGREVQIRRTDKDGTCTITAKIGNLTETCQITVRLHPTFVEEILFDVPDEVHMKAIGESFTITPTILPTNATDKTIEWYSNTKDNVVVDQTGKVTAKNYGGSTVFAFAKDGSGVYKSIRVYVDRPAVLATGIEIEPQFPRTFYAIGDQLALTATITPANATNKEVLWKSDNESVATVSEGGLVTITGWGSCLVTATTTDGTNLTSDPCYIDAEDPANIWEPVPGTGLSLDQKEVTIIKGQETSVLINMTPANCNYQPNCWNLEEWEVFQPVIGDFRVEEDYEKHTYSLMVRSYPDDMGGQSGTAHIVVCLPDHALDKDKLREMGYPEDYVPTDTLTVHVIAPIYFTAKSEEGIDVTYHVPSLERDECEVYADLDEQNWDIDMQDFVTTPAVPVTSAGKLTVPSKATDSSTGKEYWVTSVGRSAFTLCDKLTEIEFSEGIRSIGDNACYRRLYALEKVTLPSSIEELNQFCFAAHPMDYAEDYNYIQRSNLREVYIKAFLPPTGPYMPFDENSGYYTPIEDTQAFFGIAEGAVLYVPTGAKENYNHYPWISGWVEDESWEEGGYEMEGWFSRIEEMDFFLDEDGIASPKSSPEGKDFNWYDLSGRKLGGRPTTPGLYIRGNKKIVIR